MVKLVIETFFVTAFCMIGLFLLPIYIYQATKGDFYGLIIPGVFLLVGIFGITIVFLKALKMSKYLEREG